jgi:hypothetical protein
MPQHAPHQEITKYRDTPKKFRYITPLGVAAGAAAAIIAAPAAMAADTGDQSYSAAPGVIDSVCVTPEMLRSTTPHRFSSVRNIPTGRAAGVIAATAAATGNDRRVSSAAGHRHVASQPLLRCAAARLSW